MPKTDAGRRDVVLVPQLDKLLKAHRLASLFSSDSDFVFPTPDRASRQAKARAADSMRTALGDGFGHLLAAKVTAKAT